MAVDHETFVLDALKAKLSPDRLKVSGKFSAILGFLVGEAFTDPQITGMTITSDGIVLAARTDDMLMNEIIGDVSDLDRNLINMGEVIGLTGEERSLLMRLRLRKVQDWRLSYDKIDVIPVQIP